MFSKITYDKGQSIKNFEDDVIFGNNEKNIKLNIF